MNSSQRMNPVAADFLVKVFLNNLTGLNYYIIFHLYYVVELSNTSQFGKTTLRRKISINRVF